jgi:hypothetical protein
MGNNINIQHGSPEQSPTLDAVGQRQSRTRDRIFHAIGTTVDVGLDTGEFVFETTGYAIGRAVNGVRRVAQATMQGNKGETYRHAA